VFYKYSMMKHRFRFNPQAQPKLGLHQARQNEAEQEHAASPGVRSTAPSNFLVGLLLSSLMGLAGYSKKALSRSGAAGAVLVGTTIFGFGGWIWGSLLVAFFVSSSMLSFFKDTDKKLAAEKFDKGSRRDLGQALANGGVGAVIAASRPLLPAAGGWHAYLGSMASVNADTWATELGVLNRQPPRLITSGQPVPPGTSGGISLLGTLASFGGGLFIGLAAWLLSQIQTVTTGRVSASNSGKDVLIAGLAGLAGSLFDSYLGATVQAIYYCDVCHVETEQEYHRACHRTPTRHFRGWRWLNNDLVNFLSAIVGALVAAGLGTMGKRR
jgi:uncharacterized protein (TIGR00297 family)